MLLFYRFDLSYFGVKLAASSKISGEQIIENIEVKQPEFKSYLNCETEQRTENEIAVLNVEICSTVMKTNHFYVQQQTVVLFCVCIATINATICDTV